jgi:hypothetical protein
MPSNSSFAAADSEHAAFLSALGDLTLAWSDVETVLYKLLKHYSGVTWPVAQALFSGTRARSAIQFIRAIADNTDLDRARVDDLEEVFSQILAINALRDFVVHNVDGSQTEFEDWDPSKRYVSDALRVSRAKKAKTYLVGSETLLAMRDDCIECCWRLHPHWEPNNKPFARGHGPKGPIPWRFQPPSPTQRRERGW